MRPPCTILFATDGGERDRLAFTVARALARARGGQLVLLHALRPEGPRVGVGRALVHLRARPEAEQAWRRLQAFDPGPEVPVQRRLEEGGAAEAILRVAGETRCELIVLGCHGTPPGGVAQHVLAHAPCGVVLVAAPEPRLV
jgi:nucleotide-binding universal stress UspA family protein